MGELQLVAEPADLADEDAAHPLAQLALPVLDQVIAAEEGDRQVAVPVGQRHLESARTPTPARLAGVAARAADHVGAAHPGHHRDMLALFQGGQVGQFGAGQVAARQMPQQVADGAHPELLELLRRPGAQHVGHRRVQFAVRLRLPPHHGRHANRSL